MTWWEPRGWPESRRRSAPDELIPLAHPLSLTFIGVDARVEADGGLVVLTSEVRTVGRTGVEMEAMTACAVAALTVYDMVKGLERGVTMERIELLEKSGGRSGTWRRVQPGRRWPRQTLSPCAQPSSRSPRRGQRARGDEGGDALTEFAASLGAELVGRVVS